MALLKSEDLDCPTSLELTPSRERVMSAAGGDQTWQYVALNLVSGQNKLKTPPDSDYVLCRQPEDEAKKLVDLLVALVEMRNERVLFEPSEPSFEFSFERTGVGGIKVEAWLDAGNALTAIYTWDAAGIRFYTTDEHVVSFIQDLKLEFRVDPPE
jgi:hypothetical protein